MQFKQLLYIVLKLVVRSTLNGSIMVNVEQVSATSLQFHIKTSNVSIDEKEVWSLQNAVRKYSLSPAVSLAELASKGLSKDQELVVAQVLSKKLSGSMKKGLENSKGNSFIFFIETLPTHEGQNQSDQVSNPKFNSRMQQETSLSFYVGSGSFHTKFYQDSTSKLYQDHSLHFSLSQISKQLSHKQSDHFSAFSVSKQRENSPGSKALVNSKSIANSNSGKPSLSQHNVSVYNLSGKQLENGSLPSSEDYKMKSSSKKQVQFNYISIEQLQQKIQPDPSFKNLCLTEKQLDNVNQSEKRKAYFKSWRGSNQFIPSEEVDTKLDFASDFTASINVPLGIQPTLINTIIKFKLNQICCAKVVIADPEYLNIQMIELIMNNYQVRLDKAFSVEESLNLIEEKKKSQCSCGNKAYILYFINLDMPGQGGLKLSKIIREKVNEGSIDRGFIIINQGINEMQGKQFEEVKKITDHCITFPLDIFAITSIIKYFIFEK